MAVGGSVAVATILVVWVLMPLYRQWSSSGSEIVAVMTRLEEMQSSISLREALMAERSRLIRKVGWLVEPRPANPEEEGGDEGPVPEEGSDGSRDKSPNHSESSGEETTAKPKTGFEADIAKAASQSGVNLKSVVSTQRRGGDKRSLRYFEIVTLKLEAECEAASLVKLLHVLEKGPRLVRVEKLALRHEEGKPGMVSFNLEVAAYERTEGP
jgi:hypothetical protein